jgi:hypothetical protein
LESRVFAKGPGPEEVSRPVLIPVSSLPTTLQGPSLGREFPAKMEDWSNQILMKLMIVESGVSESTRGVAAMADYSEHLGGLGLSLLPEEKQDCLLANTNIHESFMKPTLLASRSRPPLYIRVHHTNRIIRNYRCSRWHRVRAVSSPSPESARTLRDPLMSLISFVCLNTAVPRVMPFVRTGHIRVVETSHPHQRLLFFPISLQVPIHVRVQARIHS